MTEPWVLTACDGDALPLVTADLPGIGGRIKDSPEDFVVDEIPAYTPSGEGEFVYLRVEKRDMSAEELLRTVSGVLGVHRSDIGQAGIKDRFAVTRQWLSVPQAAEPRVGLLEGAGVRILETGRHTNKLKTGHLRGNAFTVVIREVDPGALSRAGAIVERLGRAGFPNFFGPQRFGADGRTGVVGLDLLRGARTRETRRVVADRFRKRLYLSAAQSALFNAVLIERMGAHGLGRVLDGDLLVRTDSGGPFVSVDRDVDQARFDAGEVVHTGPIFGRKMRSAAGEALAMEQAVLALAALPTDAFTRFGRLTLGTRRPNVVRPRGLAVEGVGDGLRLRFELPRGSYATVLLRELTRVVADGEDELEDDA